MKWGPYTPFIDTIAQTPRWLLRGPWSPTSYIFLLLTLFGLYYYFPFAVQTFPTQDIATSKQLLLLNPNWTIVSGILHLLVFAWAVFILLILFLQADKSLAIFSMFTTYVN